MPTTTLCSNIEFQGSDLSIALYLLFPAHFQKNAFHYHLQAMSQICTSSLKVLLWASDLETKNFICKPLPYAMGAQCVW